MVLVLIFYLFCFSLSLSFFGFALDARWSCHTHSEHEASLPSKMESLPSSVSCMMSRASTRLGKLQWTFCCLERLAHLAQVAQGLGRGLLPGLVGGTAKDELLRKIETVLLLGSSCDIGLFWTELVQLYNAADDPEPDCLGHIELTNKKIGYARLGLVMPCVFFNVSIVFAGYQCFVTPDSAGWQDHFLTISRVFQASALKILAFFTHVQHCADIFSNHEQWRDHSGKPNRHSFFVGRTKASWFCFLHAPKTKQSQKDTALKPKIHEYRRNIAGWCGCVCVYIFVFIYLWHCALCIGTRWI